MAPLNAEFLLLLDQQLERLVIGELRTQLLLHERLADVDARLDGRNDGLELVDGGRSSGVCKRRSNNPSLEATEWLGCAGVQIRQAGSPSLIRAGARDEGRGTLREGTTCGSD